MKPAINGHPIERRLHRKVHGNVESNLARVECLFRASHLLCSAIPAITARLPRLTASMSVQSALRTLPRRSLQYRCDDLLIAHLGRYVQRHLATALAQIVRERITILITTHELHYSAVLSPDR